MHPADVVRCHADLADRLRTEAFRGYLRLCLRHMGPDRDLGQDQEALVKVTHGNVKMAENYLVSREMSDLVVAAAEALDEEDVFDLTVAPSPSGLARFDKPIPMTDVRGRQMLSHWVLWGPCLVTGEDGTTGRGMLVTWFNDSVTEPDEVAKALRADRSNDSKVLSAMVGRWDYVGTSTVCSGSPLGPRTVDPSQGYADMVRAQGDEVSAGATNMLRGVHALWLLMRQTIVSTQRASSHPSATAAAKRAKIPPLVSTVHLRRSVSLEPSQGHHEVHWQHRWLVRGHWRWQACGTGRAERKRIWVEGFIKGPDGAPFVANHETVYALVR
jgi:hypothetical protein